VEGYYVGAVRDPHVTRLQFEIRPEKGTSYENPEPLTFENPLGQFDARDGKLLVEPVDHFADETAARSIIEPFLRSWEIETDLDANPGTIRFRFQSADVIDRDPPPPGSDLSIQLVGESLLITGGTIETLITRRKYPQPPTAFEATVDVARAHARWLDYRAGREPLPSMGYFVLTLVETAAGSRKNAAGVFQIHSRVLDKLGELVSTRGGPATARKAPSGGLFQELTGAEQAWLEQAVRKLVKRLGEHASGATLSRLTLGDLPKL
jgi:hypothetical protein